MFAFDLKLTQVWFKVALLVLSFSICPYSCYPDTEEDEDTTEVEEQLDNNEDQESGHDDGDEGLEEEEEEEEDDTPTTTETIAYCITTGRPCGSSANPDGLPCCTNQYGEFYECGMYMGLNCIKLVDDEIQNELQKIKFEEIVKNKQDIKPERKLCDWYCKKTAGDRTGFRFLTPYCPC